jgi:hypothetical protein
MVRGLERAERRGRHAYGVVSDMTLSVIVDADERNWGALVLRVRHGG